MNLLSNYADRIMSVSSNEISTLLERSDLLIDEATVRSKQVRMMYAPFDHVNHRAKVVIVGLTPGRQQARNALSAAQDALKRGLDIAAAAAAAKVFASFSGPLRSNLVRLLDGIGLSRRFGLQSATQLWADRTDLAHFTSLLRYPVFVDGKDWSGQPDAVATPAMREWIVRYTGRELSQFKDAVIVPLGPKVAGGLEFLARQGLLDQRRLLSGLPHPSGANAERIACFLGDKPPELASTKTNAAALITARETIMARVSAL